MNFTTYRRFHVVLGALLMSTLWHVGCDTIQPDSPGTLVLEAVLSAGQVLPPVRLHETTDVHVGPQASRIGVPGADIMLKMRGLDIQYVQVPDSAGLYRPTSEAAGLVPNELEPFQIFVRAEERTAEASGIVPPRIDLESVTIKAAEHAIEAVLIDSLTFGLDSLTVSIDATEGFIYPVEVTFEWEPTASPGSGRSAADDFWIETRLIPRQTFSSPLLEFFLLTEQILREENVAVAPSGNRRWTGVYAVPVDNAESSLPVHDLFVSLLRSGRDYARFQATSDEPERREPEGNVVGGLGFVGGISVDSLTVRIE